jgi:DNA-binding MarR family transcriptional regulator
VSKPRQRLNDTQIEAYEAFIELAALLRTRLENHMRESSSLTNVQFQILGKLMRSTDQQLRMSDLADGIVLSKSGLTYQVGLLVESGLLSRSSLAGDERTILVSLTPKGREEFLDALPGHAAIVNELLLEGLSADEVATLSSLLSKLRDRARG